MKRNYEINITFRLQLYVSIRTQRGTHNHRKGIKQQP